MQRPYVLIVDPDRESRRALRAYLERHGYPAVWEAEDGASGLELAGRLRPDLVIGDFPMDVPGHSPFLPALRQEMGCAAPVIVVTSARSPVEVAEYLEPYSEAVLSKPVAPAEVFAAVDRLLNRL